MARRGRAPQVLTTRTRRAPLLSIAAPILAAALAGCSAPPPAADGEAPAERAAAPVPRELPATLARVNGEAVERWEIETALREITLANLHPIPQAERDELVRGILDRIVEHHLAAQEARRRGLGASDAELDADLREMRREHASDRAFDDMLATRGISLEQLRHQRRLSLEASKLARALRAGRPPLSEEDLRAYYRDNPGRFTLPETVTARHILIRAAPDSADERARARRRAEDLLREARDGADFAKLAAAHSEDAATAASGGELGTFPRGQMDSPFEAAAFAAKPGELSGVVETQHGFHIIRVDARHAGRTRPFEEVREDIRTLLTDRAELDALETAIEDAKRGATIEILI